MLQGKHILVGISGGIAAYKIPELIRLLVKAGAEVRVTTTKNALQFVTTLTLETLSNASVYSDVFAAINEHKTEHISLPRWADLMVIAPATADVLAKCAHGIADDALTTTYSATVAQKPVLMVPAMNDQMYQSAANQQALQTLAATKNVTILDAAEGELACGSNGKGRMQEPEQIVAAADYMLTDKDLIGRHILITAGPTQEPLDPVRYLSNYSTGKMGYALARQAYRRGAHVTLISGPTNLPAEQGVSTFIPTQGIETISVKTAEEMYHTCLHHWNEADTAILCAAVADFTPHEVAGEKIKKAPGQQTFSLSMDLTHDIAAALGQTKQARQQLIGFALETQNETANALHKLESKHLDMIVLNSLRNPGAGFGCDTNIVTFIKQDGTQKKLPPSFQGGSSRYHLNGTFPLILLQSTE